MKYDLSLPRIQGRQLRMSSSRFGHPGAQPDPYNQGYGMPPNPYGGQPGYGHPGMMGGHGGHGHGHGHGHGYGGMGGHMGGSGGGRGGSVPFRAGDWQCGNEGCKYHNFAKNTSCLRCGASRSQAAIIAEGGMTTFPGNSYGGPPPNMSMGSSMGGQSYGGMSQEHGQYGASAMGGPPGNFGGQSYGPPSTYALPSGIGAQPSPYMPGGYSQMASNGGMPSQAGGFDSRAEQAFNQGNSSAAAGAIEDPVFDIRVMKNSRKQIMAESYIFRKSGHLRGCVLLSAPQVTTP